ncbi:MAG: TatD family hydrolase [Actinomyces sp.]|uniref:TatD family hydrolase n=1 Tax=Actinomyces sp. TaxID=29317 RepID=UPI0026DD0F54|nr:TatD family hydrolase [Actinomyces sp.]MDO4243497.1 TatD family hydrolase [Actinomyces sp.]
MSRGWPPLEALAALPLPVTDNHTHLPVPDLPATGPGSREPLTAAELVERAAGLGVTRVITSACETPTWEGSIELARRLPGVRVALAVHPNEAVLHAGVREVGPDGLPPAVDEHHGEPLEEAMSRLEALVRGNRDVVVAVGESGMDLFRTGPEGARVQRGALREHIALAKELDLPLQIHDREAHADCLEVLLADGAPERTVFHCFSGGADLAEACAEHGWYASVAGPVTYPANRALREALALVPDDLLLAETDAPYLPAHPWRGHPNASYLMGVTVRFLAELRGVDLETMCTRLQATTEEVYGNWM